MFRHIFITLTSLVFINLNGMAQELQAVNRIATGDAVIHLNEAPGAGVAWIKGSDFGNGTIEFDVKGKNVLQRSFVGIAFHGVNDSTYDAVYFRPFNFQVPEKGRRAHSVQYISLPNHEWFQLRDEFPGKYENEIDPTTDPNAWFHVKIVINFPEVSTFINGKRCLSVTQLSKQKSGMVGYWVGNGSAGDWKNLVFK
jgi:hypothetical protein